MGQRRWKFETSPIYRSTFFSTFDMDQSEKIRRHHWKEQLKISVTAKFESDSANKVSKIYRRLYSVYGGSTKQMSVKFRDFLMHAILR